MAVIKGQVLANSTVFTDGWKAYDSLVTEGYDHHRIHHHENEFARGKNHVNGIESFWSFAKLRLAKLRGVRQEKFLMHLLESAWRFNHRQENRFRLILRHCRKNPLVCYLRPLHNSCYSEMFSCSSCENQSVCGLKATPRISPSDPCVMTFVFRRLTSREQRTWPQDCKTSPSAFVNRLRTQRQLLFLNPKR